jgi:hypothetical protein
MGGWHRAYGRPARLIAALGASALVFGLTAWCLRGTTNCAQFFGGITSNNSTAVMWQWSGGGGTFNGFGDFDQIDVARTPS